MDDDTNIHITNFSSFVKPQFEMPSPIYLFIYLFGQTVLF